MTAARLGRRQTQNQEITALKARVAELEAEVNKWRTWYAEQKKAGKL
jgi:cell division protein FtsB